MNSEPFRRKKKQKKKKKKNTQIHKNLFPGHSLR